MLKCVKIKKVLDNEFLTFMFFLNYKLNQYYVIYNY